MAAVTRREHPIVGAANPGEGRAIAALWRELWDAHEAWGGYPGSHDARAYQQLAARLDQDARVRAGHPVLGRHVHLVARIGRDVVHVPALVARIGRDVVGQVEGWFERHGVELSTPYTCEVRSLIVTDRARGAGVGRALLDALAQSALELSRGAPTVLAAEVLEPNPAHTFYARVGYVPVAYAARIASSATGFGGLYAARIAEPRDAHAIAVLEGVLAARRRSVGDVRFDRPRAVDATFIGAVAAHLARDTSDAADSLDLVVTDASGTVRGAASFAVNTLEPPFLPVRRGMVGRFAIDPALSPAPLVPPLVALACKLAVLRGAPAVELTDLTAPGTPLHAAALATGAYPWSRVVTRHVG